MKNKIVFGFLLVAMFASLSLPAMAAFTHENYAIPILGNENDSLEYTQAEYLSNIYRTNSTFFVSQATKERNEIGRVCIGLLSMGNASSRSVDYDITALTVDQNELSEGFQYYKSVNDYLFAVRNALGWSVYKDSLEYSDFEVEISGDTAVASVVESYSYYLDSDFESDYCFRKRCYHIALVKTGDGLWKVTSVSIEGTEDEAPINIAEKVHAAVTSHQESVLKSNIPATEAEIYGKSLDEEATERSTALYRWTYDVEAGIKHAETYYNSVDKRFGEASADCTNFTSQCVWVGLGGTGSKTDLPALSKDYLGGQNFKNLWCRGWDSTYYPAEYFRRNWTWDNVKGFTNMIEVSSSTTEGPFGNTHYGNLDYAAAGSVIAYTTSKVADDYNLTHAMYVTDVTGTVGSRGVSNIWIAAHNSNTSSAYMPLTEYTSKNESQFATSVIGWGYYASPQP